MKLFNKVRGSMKVVPNIEANIDTIYIRTNILAIDTEDFKGWEYDEIQYGKDEYTELLQEQINTAKADNATLWYESMNQLDKVTTNETEISNLWYEIMNLGGI